MSVKNICIPLSLLLILIVAACSKKIIADKSVATAPAVKATSYAITVKPLMEAKCTPCHFPSKRGFKTNFENYASAKLFAADMVSRIELNTTDKGFMPLSNPKLSADEIAIFKSWVEGGMQE